MATSFAAIASRRPAEVAAEHDLTALREEVQRLERELDPVLQSVEVSRLELGRRVAALDVVERRLAERARGRLQDEAARAQREADDEAVQRWVVTASRTPGDTDRPPRS